MMLKTLQYFRRYRSVGVLRGIMDLEAQGLTEIEVIQAINILIDRNVLKSGGYVIDYVGVGGGGEKLSGLNISPATVEKPKCSRCDRKITEAFTLHKGKVVCLDCYSSRGVEPDVEHLDLLRSLLIT